MLRVKREQDRRNKGHKGARSAANRDRDNTGK